MPHKLYAVPRDTACLLEFREPLNPLSRSNLHSPAGNVIPREKCRSDVVITIVRTAKKTIGTIPLSLSFSFSLRKRSFYPTNVSSLPSLYLRDYDVQHCDFDRSIFHFSSGAFKSLITSHEHRLYILLLLLLLLSLSIRR